MMEHYLHPMMEYLRSHPFLSLLFTFCIALIEALPIVGTVVPGSVTMTAIGVMVGSGVLPVVPTFIVSILGAFVGDCLGFWLGSAYHEQIRQVWPFTKITKWLDYGERFFGKHGGKSIIIGRFIGPTRSAMPLIAGMLRLNWEKFILAALIAAILWSLLYMLPGVLLGAVALDLPHEELTKFFLFGIGIIVCLWLIFWIAQYSFKNVRRYVNKKISAWWYVMRSHKMPHFLVRIISNQQKLQDFHQLTLLIVAVLFSILFLIIWISVLQQ
jgi:membrane protein DedA with SNARE-associated domain